MDLALGDMRILSIGAVCCTSGAILSMTHGAQWDQTSVLLLYCLCIPEGVKICFSKAFKNGHSDGESRQGQE